MTVDKSEMSLKPVRCGCGGEAVLCESDKYDSFDFTYMIYCKECGISSDVYDTEAEAIEAWNRAMSAKDINVHDKNTVIVEPFTTDMNHVGYCKCGYLVNAEWKYCPHCGARLEWK